MEGTPFKRDAPPALSIAQITNGDGCGINTGAISISSMDIEGADTMSKGKDTKKQTKKKPAKTLQEKKAAKRAAKDTRGSLR